MTEAYWDQGQEGAREHRVLGNVTSVDTWVVLMGFEEREEEESGVNSEQKPLFSCVEIDHCVSENFT